MSDTNRTTSTGSSRSTTTSSSRRTCGSTASPRRIATARRTWRRSTGSSAGSTTASASRARASARSPASRRRSSARSRSRTPRCGRVATTPGAPRGHGPRRHPRVGVLPDDHALLRAAVHGGERPRVRSRLPEGLQRLADRRVVRRRARALHPAHPHPDVGHRSSRSGRWSGARRRAQRRSCSPRTPGSSGSRRSTTRTGTGTR